MSDTHIDVGVYEPMTIFQQPEPTNSNGSAPVKLPTKTRLNVTVKKLHVTAAWKWNEGGEDTCGICRMEFEAACTNCKFPGDDCPLVLGMCRHAFHRHCIDKWTSAPTNTPRAQCPLCRQDWVMIVRRSEQ
ncbi:unnamed protein product [Caenorhabditis bovis]|uniref:Anaphase-promoting complex subunit 11 n=1 Tax=Caenorhabditis bovis TaxID=2654633 RepID=A0A8S1F275_9PELO|nr:unnamed protein product [Caenorhabditis bovis]